MAKLLAEKYEITKKVNLESVTIIVEINSDDEVTIRTHDGKPQFVFTRSNASRVLAMGQAIQEAGELVKSRKEKAA